MVALLFDTATKCGVAALFEGERLLAKREFAAAFTNSKFLLPIVSELLENCNLTVKDLQYIAVGVGPGSYTGIRVAVAFAKGLSFSLQIPLVALSSIKGFLPDPNRGEDCRFMSAIDARIGGIYCICGHRTSGKIHFDTAEELLSIEDFITKLDTASMLITPEGEGSLLQSRIPSIDIQAKIIESNPSIEYLALLAQEAFSKGECVLDGHLPLLYLRPTQAEINARTLLPNIGNLTIILLSCFNFVR